MMFCQRTALFRTLDTAFSWRGMQEWSGTALSTGTLRLGSQSWSESLFCSYSGPEGTHGRGPWPHGFHGAWSWSQNRSGSKPNPYMQVVRLREGQRI